MTDTSLQPASTRSRATTLVGESRELFDLARQAHTWWLNKITFSVSIDSDDPIYHAVHAWILNLLPEDQRRSLKAQSVIASANDYASSSDVPATSSSTQNSTSRVVLTSTDTIEQRVVIDGQPIRVRVFRGEAVDGSSHSSRAWRDPDQLIFIARNRTGQRVVTRHLDRILEERNRNQRQPVIRLLNTSWGTWNSRGDLPPRPIETVVLADGQLERLTGDLRSFLEEEKTYNARAVPWHRGYLLHGPPGTGKTSIAKALANEFGLDLWYAPLGDVKDDSNLLNLLSQVHPRSMLLLEDVDVFAATHERSETQKLSLSGILNALDGVATPHGLVTIMTTNVPDVLDQALVRPGRIDLVEEIKMPDDEQVWRMFTVFYGQTAPWKLHAGGRSSAEVTEVFKQHMHSPNDAANALSRARAVTAI